MKQGNEIKTKKCMDCNINQAKCKGGLCRGCYKKQGCEGMKKFCVDCFKIGKKITAYYDDDLCKDCFRGLSLKELGKEYNCVVCIQNGKKVSARHKGRLCRKCFWKEI